MIVRRLLQSIIKIVGVISRVPIMVAVAFLVLGNLAHARPDPRFKIGVVLPLSGKTAEYGEAIRNSIELAINDSPNEFTNIQFIYEDAGYEASRAVSGFNKLRSVDKVQLLYVWGVVFCQALAPLAEAAKMPMVAQCVDSNIAKNRQYIIRFMNYSDEYMAELLLFLRSKNLSNFGVVLSDNAYLEEMYEALKRKLSGQEKIKIVDRYQMGQNDFRTTIIKLHQGEFDAVGVFLGAGQISAFYKQKSELNYHPFTFGTNFFESKSEIIAAGGTMKGAVFSFNKVGPEFEQRYNKHYGSNSQLTFGALSYEFARLSAELFGQANEELAATEIMSRLGSVVSHPGLASGPYAFTDSDTVGPYFSFPIVVKEVGDDLLHPLN